METSNDFNDRAIVNAAIYFAKAVGGAGSTIFISNDTANRVREYIDVLDCTDLIYFCILCFSVCLCGITFLQTE
jgi:hypothetical protein